MLIETCNPHTSTDIRTCIHTYIHAYIHTVHTYIHTYICTCTYLHMYIYTVQYTHTCVQSYCVHWCGVSDECVRMWECVHRSSLVHWCRKLSMWLKPCRTRSWLGGSSRKTLSPSWNIWRRWQCATLRKWRLPSRTRGEVLVGRVTKLSGCGH